MKALLTTSAPPPKSPFSTTEKRPPLGVGTLIAVGREAGHEIKFIDNYLKRSNFELDGYLVKNDIDVVGIYSNTICFQDTLRMLRGIQHLRDEGVWRGKVAVGGPHVAVQPESIPGYVDYVVMGEGEEAWVDILNRTAPTGYLRYPRMVNLDVLPFQPWDVFGKGNYDWSCPWMDGVEPVFTMNTSRGCPFGCAFCSVESIWGKMYTKMSAERVVDEIEHVVNNYGAQGIYFREDNFTLSRKRTDAFCEEMHDRGLQDLPWACETRVDKMTMGRVKRMADAGCCAFYLGVESGSQRMLNKMNKNILVQNVQDMIVWAKMYGIRSYASLITGVPGETVQDLLATEKFMEELDPYHWGYNVFVGIPHSDMYEECVEQGLVEHTDENGLIYPPGFDVKTKFFYNKDSSEFVDAEFTERTQFDKDLLALRPKWMVNRGVRWAKRQVRKRIGRADG